MRLHHHIGLIIIICSLGGVGLSFGLGGAWEETGVGYAQLSMNSATLNNVARLRKSTTQWHAEVEEMASTGDYARLEGLQHRTLDLRRHIWTLRGQELAAEYDSQLEHIYSVIARADSLMRSTIRMGEDKGSEYLVKRQTDLRSESFALVQAIGTFEEFLQASAQRDENELHRRTIWIQQFSLMALLGYAVVVVVLWSWTVVSLIRPIRALIDAARGSMERGEPFELEARGPKEVVTLTRSISTLVSGLQASQESMERSIEERTSELVRANRAKSEFLANVSHEIRTPLTAILGYAELAVESTESEETRRDYLNTIHSNSHHLLEIINDILDLSKIEAGRVTAELVRFSPQQTVGDVAHLMAVRAKEKNLSFSAEYVGPIPATIQSDPTRLRQILINLLGNAIKFTRTGGVKLVVRMHEGIGDAPSQLAFEVIDTGIGLTDAKHSEIFEPFSQADASTTRRFGGTGLGLAISKSLAELLGGDISVTGNHDRGSSFKLSIDTGPLDDIEMHDDLGVLQLDDINSSLQAAIHKASLEGRVLLAEDGDDNRRLISTILTQCGLEVHIATNGREAVDLVTAAWHGPDSYDVILMDMQMPEVDGYAATSQLREAGYRGPIIALTAHAMIGSRSECLEAGCDDFATKPLDRKVLLGLVEEWISVKDDWKES